MSAECLVTRQTARREHVVLWQETKGQVRQTACTSVVPSSEFCWLYNEQRGRESACGLVDASHCCRETGRGPEFESSGPRLHFEKNQKIKEKQPRQTDRKERTPPTRFTCERHYSPSPVTCWLYNEQRGRKSACGLVDASHCCRETGRGHEFESSGPRLHFEKNQKIKQPRQTDRKERTHPLGCLFSFFLSERTPRGFRK